MVFIFVVTIKKRQIIAFVCLILVLLIAPAIRFNALQPEEAFNPEGGVPIPIIMYHSILKDSSRWGDYVISPEAIEDDLLWLSQNGYESVRMSDIIAYVEDGTSLPEKPVLITFDDGYLNNMLYLPDILEKHDAYAVVSVVGEYIDIFSNKSDPNPSYAHMTWDDICELSKNPRIEIQNHSYTMHHQSERRGSQQKKSESREQYKAALTNDAQRLSNSLLEKCGIAVSTFTYPYGQITSGADNILREAGFRATLSCYERIDTLHTGRTETLYSLGRYNRPANMTTESFMKKVFSK